MKGLFRALLRDSAELIHRLDKRLSEYRHLDESKVAEEWQEQHPRPPQMPPLEPVEVEAQLQQHPLLRKSPLLFKTNRRAIERVIAKRGIREGDTIYSLLNEAKENT